MTTLAALPDSASRDDRPFSRPRECLVSGTAAGLASHLGLPVTLVRLLFLLALPLLGAGLLFYLWLWLFVPWQKGEQAPSRRAPVAWILAALAIIVLLLALPWLGWSMVRHNPVAWLTITVLALAAGLWASVVDAADPARGRRHALVMRLLMTVVLGILFFTEAQNTFGSIIGPLIPLLALVAIWVSPLMTRLRELGGERIARIREEQRAEMAAHLHDSVLQTLALIQNRAGASTDVARIARAQERELRAWLYDGDSPADSDLATDLRDYAGALELDYPVRIDVVSAGLSTERASGEVAAAAREAMLNAARHAGGEVSVYIEGRTDGVEVWVRDRGSGFSLDDVPGDRLGVRESIIGRMRRIGAAASVRSESSGTEVHLRFLGTGDGRG